jgi:hypothetical protein
MQRFINIIGLLTVVVLMVLGINSILPQGGFIIVGGERISKWTHNEPAITLPVMEDQSAVKVVPTRSSNGSLYFRAIDYIQEKDGMAGADDFWRACEDSDNLRREAHKHDLAAIIAAIRYAENGRAGREYGALSAYAKDTTYRKQAGECATSVQANWDRYIKGGPCLNQINGGNCSIEHQPQDSRDIYSFIGYQGHVYCPIGADNDPDGLNSHWVKNVTNHYNHILDLCK